MSLPPSLIHVKRKRTEDAPVPSFLRIEHHTKRHRSDAFLYRRHDPEAAARAATTSAAFPAPRPPTIHISKPGDENRKKTNSGAEAGSTEQAGVAPASPQQTDGAAPAPASAPGGRTTTEPTREASPRPHRTVSAAEPRRFHLSRNSLLAAHSTVASLLGVPGTAARVGRRRTRYGLHGQTAAPEFAAVFVERGKRRRRHALAKQAAAASTTAHTRTTTTTPTVEAVQAPLPKRPGWKGPKKPAGESAATAGTAPAGQGATSGVGEENKRLASLPPSVLNRQWNTDMDKLAREMNDYTLEIIGRNLARMQDETTAAAAAAAAANNRRALDRQQGEMDKLAAERRRAAYDKYKPKPVPRSAARQPPSPTQRGGRDAQDGGGGGGGGGGYSGDDDAAMEDLLATDAAAASGMSGEDGLDEGSETDEDDYVTETYIRIPGHEMSQVQAAASAGGPGNVGLLVFDNEPDMEFFYGAEEDSEEEFEDDEDENAENYYAHDYPEDEVSSDDEYDRDPYRHYRNGNASDLEEFEDSDDEEERRGEGDGEAAFDGMAHLANMRLTKASEI
ncbi:Transcription factor Iwr1 [Niveomyces insectorum RCEF 264]|uniref:Transcription factor Iwr1 n=1 Tax=Niveomyces insectorum RCEF 264 TaxID=1081102 RepID=A0A167RGN4_9HYPO|nr:Transcription factor Iwr1 [Niveomyces insectorum RCEF 264]